MYTKNLILALVGLGMVSAAPVPKDTSDVGNIIEVRRIQGRMPSPVEDYGGHSSGDKRDLDRVNKFAASRENHVEARDVNVERDLGDVAKAAAAAENTIEVRTIEARDPEPCTYDCSYKPPGY